jgi:hypothetical protein
MTRVANFFSPIPPRAIVVLAVLVVLAGTLAAIVLASRQTAGGEAPPEAPPFAGFDPETFARFSVRTVEPGRAVLIADAEPGQSTDATRDLDPAGAAIEVLRPIAPADIRPGDRLTVVAVQNDVRNFAIRSIVIQRDGTADGNGVVRSPLGFVGSEASMDLAERAVMGGVVQSPADGVLTLERDGAPLTVTLTEGSFVYSLEPGTSADLHAGDRVAVSDETSQPRVLVLPSR